MGCEGTMSAGRANHGTNGASHETGRARRDATAPEGAVLAFNDLSFSRGERLVISGLTYQVRAGRLTCLVGRNGCGKSTLLGLAGGVLRARSGSVLLCGREISTMSERERSRELAILAQAHAAPAMRVRELVALGRYPYRGDGDTASDEAAVERALALTGLTDLSDAWVDRLSGGQRQRAHIALAIAQETTALLMDEPTTYLDAAGCHEVLRLARGLAHGGRTVLAVVHDLDLALRYADELAVMDGGRIACSGAPAAVLATGALQDLFDVRIHPFEAEGETGYLLFPR